MPKLKNRIQAHAAQLITSSFAEKQKRLFFNTTNRLSKKKSKASIYLRVDDPYSYLLIQAFNKLGRKFTIPYDVIILSEVPQELYPEYEKLQQYAIEDCKRLAKHLNLYFPEKINSYPSDEIKKVATGILYSIEKEDAFFDTARAIYDLFWVSDEKKLKQLSSRLDHSDQDFLAKAMQKRSKQLLEKGHYLSSTVYFDGEWYWGVDRLHHLLERIQSDALEDWRQPFIKAPQSVSQFAPHIDFYFSFRSPYSYLCLPEMVQFCQTNNLTLNVKPVLPMVMRGMQVPNSKKFYILLDAAREARIRSIPFGKIVDPVGDGVERCMALYDYAKRADKNIEYLLSVSAGIWSEGRDVTDDKDLRLLVERAGLHWHIAEQYLQQQEWQGWAKKNRNDLFSAGLWGVPSFSCGGKHYWGQDRIWALANDFA